MVARVSTAPRFQMGFIILLVVCLGQTTWWIIDNARYTTQTRDRTQKNWEEDIHQAKALLAASIDPQEVARLFPGLIVTADGASVPPGAALELEDARFRRITRYGWEGSFFLAVLAAGVFVLSMALRQQARLQSRQENFVAAVSHELKSPLASIRLSTETLSLRDPPPERRAKLVRRILDDVERLEVMITNILDVRSIEEGRRAATPERFGVADAVQAVLEELKPTLEERGATVDVDVPEGLALTADPLGFHSVLRNLVDNASKAATKADDRRISMTVSRAGDAVEVRVRDRGMGFPPKEADRLFQKFYRLGNELQRTTKGSGLGLYLTLRLLQLEGGSIEARSEGTGQGAEFIARWPSPAEEEA